MAEPKYGEYIIREPLTKALFVESVVARNDLLNADMQINYHCITEPFLMEKDAHKHDFEQFLCFFGGNPLDIRDFGAEVELFLGEEGEKHIIDATTIVHIPKGFVHCPLNFKKIDKPIIFQTVIPTGEYIRKSASGQIIPMS